MTGEGMIQLWTFPVSKMDGRRGFSMMGDRSSILGLYL